MIQRKIILLLSSLLFVLGCFDFTIIQYIEQQKDKSLIITIRVTSPFLKDKKKSSAIDENEFKNKIIADNITLLSSRSTVDDLAGTAEFVFKIKQLPSKLEQPPRDPFLPYKDKNGQFIFFTLDTPIKQSANKDLIDTKEITEAMLAAAKYRLAFGNMIPKKALIIVNRTQIEKFNLSIYQMGNVYCIDIPMNLMFMNESAVIVSFTNTINDSEISNYFVQLRKKREEEERKKWEEQQKKDEIEKSDEDKNNNDNLDNDDYNKYENDSDINNDNETTDEDTNTDPDTETDTDSDNIER